MSFIQDKRDDPIDSHHGTYTSIDLALALHAAWIPDRFRASGGAQFLLLSAHQGPGAGAHHGLRPDRTLRRICRKSRWQSDSSAAAPSPTARFPISRPARAIPSTGFPIGGNALFMNTVELRFPLIGDNLGGVLFNDLGNVYSAVNKISLRFRQQNLQDFDYAVQGFGFGLRYRTPLGPVRVDFSLSPNSPRFFGCEGSINQLYQCGVQARQFLRPCSALMSSNSISRWGRRSDGRSERTPLTVVDR